LIKNCNIEEAKQMPNDMDKLTTNYWSEFDTNSIEKSSVDWKSTIGSR
jgi:hypothetical protein